MEPKQVKDFGNEYKLECVDFVVADILRIIGKESEVGEWPCLFVKTRDGDILEVWGIPTNVPRLNVYAEPLYVRGD